MARVMRLLLYNDKLFQKLRAESLRQAEKILFKKHAEEIVQSWKQHFTMKKQVGLYEKPILAYFSPLNPQLSGISDYSEELLLYLKDLFDIKLFTNELLPTNPLIMENFEIVDYTRNQELLENIQYRIYYMGNHPLHDWIYNALKRFSGIVVLHETNLFDFFVHTTYRQGKQEDFRHEIAYCYGEQGLEAFRLLQEGEQPNPLNFPMHKKVVEMSNGVIVHNAYAKEIIAPNTANNENVKIIPIGFQSAQDQKKCTQEMLKKSLGLDLQKIALGVFGNVVPIKRIHVILESFSKLLKTNPNTQLYIVGHINSVDNAQIYGLLRKFRIQHHIQIIPSPDLHQFNAYIQAVDICINLRYPTMGESSATLIRAMGYGKPCIVSNIGSYKEFPDDCVWKVDIETYEQELLLAYLIELCNNPLLREKMGISSRNYVALNHDMKQTAQLYFDFITRNHKENIFPKQ